MAVTIVDPGMVSAARNALFADAIAMGRKKKSLAARKVSEREASRGESATSASAGATAPRNKADPAF